MDLFGEGGQQPDLFGTTAKLEEWRPVYAAIDMLDQKYGKHTVYLGTTQGALRTKAHQNARSETPIRLNRLFKGENKRQHIGIPMLGEVK
jgi:hypothetical protein